MSRWAPGMGHLRGAAPGLVPMVRRRPGRSGGRHTAEPVAEALRHPTAPPHRRDRATVLAAVAAVVAAESIVAFVDPLAGAVMQGLLLLLFLGRWVLAGDVAILVLALVPLGRLTSLALTPRFYEPVTYALTGMPLLLGVLWMARSLSGPSNHEHPVPAWSAVAVALAGLPLGWAAHALLTLPAFDDPDAAVTIAVGIPVTFLFAGILEELLFRGLLQRILEPTFDGWAVVLADVLFVAAYLPVRDPGVLAFMAVLGLASGWYVRHAGRVAPVAIAHGLMAASALVLWPAIA